jgi:hypothetical protein
VSKDPSYLTEQATSALVVEAAAVGSSVEGAAAAGASAVAATSAPHHVTIQRDLGVADGHGGYTPNWVDIATNVGCTLTRAASPLAQVFPKPKEEIIGGRMRTVQVWSASFERDEDVRAMDRVVYENDEGFDFTFEVVDTSYGTEGSGRMAILKRIGPQGF